jgi:hypothetical protein
VYLSEDILSLKALYSQVLDSGLPRICPCRNGQAQG